MRKNILKGLVIGAAMLAASAGANAYEITIGGNTVTFDSIDWSSGGTVWSPNYNPAGGVGTNFDLYFQASAATLNLGANSVYSFTAASPFELTIVAALNETVIADNGSTQNFTLNNGTWKVFQDAAKNANQSNGVGFADGSNILAGTFLPGTSGSFTAISLSSGFGVEALFGLVDASPSGVITPHPDDTNTLTTLQAGIFTTGWTKPTGFTNGVDGGTDAAYDPATQLVLQADANQAFANNVPEPGSMALLGLSLAGLGALRRRK